jgi:hypothetical protein
MPPSGDIEGVVSEDEEYWIFGYGSLIWKCVPYLPLINSLFLDLLPISTNGSLDSLLRLSVVSGSHLVITEGLLKRRDG